MAGSKFVKKVEKSKSQRVARQTRESDSGGLE